MQDKLAEIIDDNYEVTNGAEVTNCTEIAQAIVASLPDMVGPLVWVVPEGHLDADYVDASGLYQIEDYVLWCGCNEDGEAFDDVESAKAAAQADYTRRILSAFGITPDTCKKCGGELAPGQAMGRTFTGIGDFHNNDAVSTFSPGGPGNLIDCMKCADCGWSVTPDKGEDA